MAVELFIFFFPNKLIDSQENKKLHHANLP